MTTSYSPDGSKPACIVWGHRLIGLGLVLLVVGHSTINVFLPEMQRGGLTPAALCLLVPIWSVMGLGLALLLLGWLRNPAFAPELKLGTERRPDGRYVGPFVQALAVILSLGWASGTVFLAVYPNEDANAPPVVLSAICYCSFCCAIFMLYLATFYSERRDLATTTYINLFFGLFAFLLVPITWPLLIFLNIRVQRELRRAEAFPGRREV